MTYEKRINIIQYSILATLWLLFVVFPLMFVKNTNAGNILLNKMMIEYGIVFAVFLIHRFILMPFLFFKKKYISYFLSLLITIFAVGFSTYFINYKTDIFQAKELPNNQIQQQHPYPPTTQGHPAFRPARAHHPPLGPKFPLFIRVATFSLLVIALDTGIRLSMKWLLSKNKEAELKEDKMKMQLSMLQNQISPHFFMNTLNNIHALVEINPQKAQEVIIELSQLMDYLLYETNNQQMVPLDREFEFIKNYINLMKIRCADNVSITITKNGDLSPMKTSPLLFLNFLENSFKHGISTTETSFVNVTVNANNNIIELDIKNSKHVQKSEKNSGLGLANVKKRLKLIYGDQYQLHINEQDNIFHVNLKIPCL